MNAYSTSNCVVDCSPKKKYLHFSPNKSAIIPKKNEDIHWTVCSGKASGQMILVTV